MALFHFIDQVRDFGYSRLISRRDVSAETGKWDQHIFGSSEEEVDLRSLCIYFVASSVGKKGHSHRSAKLNILPDGGLPTTVPSDDLTKERTAHVSRSH